MTAQPEPFGTSSAMDSIARGSEMETLMRAIFPGESEMARRMRAFDWSASALGSTHDWPENLRVAIRLCLTSRFPICLWWARPLRFLYNDAFLPWLSDTKHPRALMELGREVWSEDWHIIGPMLERVIATGDASWSEDVELYHNRKVPQEEVYITWSFTPILAADGRTVDGIFCPCSETTEKVIGARRLETLRKLAVRAGEARSVDGACDAAVAVMGENARDIPFAAIYVAGANDDDTRLSAAALQPGEHSLPSTVRASDDDAASPWPLARALRTKRAADCLGIDARGVQLHAGPWRDLTQTALVVPIHAAQDDLAGLLVVGVSPRRPLDAAYRTFFDLVAGHIATAISGAQAYEAQRERAEALAQIDRAKTAFFSNVSHEFRTPLTLMLGPIEEEMLSCATGPLTIERAKLDLVYRNTLRLLKLVNTLLDFSRIEAGRVQANYEAVDLPAYTAELASVFRAAIEKAGLRLSIDCPSLNGPVYVDRSMWEKIVLNLISNAFKFTFEGEIEVSLRRDDKFATLAVRDTGIGIEEDQLPRLFERFHRIEGARGRTYEGSGIGLALVQDLVKLHGGTVAVESIYGQGSIFRVAIPLGQAHLPAKQVGPKPVSTAVGANAFVEEALRWLPEAANETMPRRSDTETSRLSSNRILFADDNADLRQYVQRLLSQTYEVQLAADGEAALRMARENPPDLVLADVMMPRLDGFGLLQALRTDPCTRNVPVILLSARAGEESRVEGLQAGADDYLIKPFSARELLARVSARLEIGRLHREALEREHKLRIAAEAAEAEVARKNEQLQEAQARTESHEAAARAIGLPREYIVSLGRTLWELFPDIVGTELGRQYHRAMDDRVPVAFDFHYLIRDTWWANRFYPTPEGLAVFATDITERKRAEEALRRAHDELEQRILERTQELSAVNSELIKEIAEQKRAEEALRKSNRRIEDILESITDEFNAFDREWRFTYINESALNSIRRAKGEELTRGEILGKNVWEIFPGHVGSIFYQKYHEALREQKTVGFEARSPVTDRWIEVNAYPSDEGLSVYYRDMTERKRIEQTLREHQQRFRVALESSAVAFTILRAVRDESARIIDFEWLYLNPAASRILRRAPEELIGRQVREVLPDAWEPSGLFDSFVQVVHTGEPRDLEVLSRGNGIDTWFRNIAAKLDDGIVVWFADVTERRRAEEALRRSEAFLAEGQRISHTGSWAVKFPSEEVFWSQELFRIYGLDPATTKLSQQMAFQLIHPKDRALVRETFKRAVRAKSDFAVEHRAILADGSIKHLCARGQPILNQSGELIEYVGAVMDITERKRAEEALQKTQAELARVSRIRTMGELAASIAHEINQPLGAIINNGNVAMRLATGENGSRDKLVEVLSDIVSDANLASAIIARIRAVMKKSTPEKVPLRLKDIVADVLRLTEHELAERRITVRTELAEDLPSVSGDRVQLQQVLLNLVINAIEAMSAVEDERRILTIRGQRDEPEGKPAVLIIVSDLGAGFKHEDSERLFEPFYTTKPHGMGMGLRISRSIIEAHGGRLWAALNDGPGATFHFALPAEESE